MGYGGKAFKGHTTQLLGFQIEFTKVNKYKLTIISKSHVLDETGCP
jgi:hypothetical protein